MKKFVGILILITLIVPVNAIPYQKNKSTSDQQQAYIDAMNDAKNALTEICMGAGCLFGIFAITASLAATP